MSQMFWIPMSGTVAIAATLVAVENGIESSFGMGAVAVVAFLITTVLWWYSPLPNGSGVGCTYGGGSWGFGSGKSEVSE